MSILNDLVVLLESFRQYRRSMKWFATLQANHLVIFDPEKREVRLSHRIPDHLEEESFRAARAYSMTYCYKEKCKARADEYARKAGEYLIKAGIPLLACIIGYVCFVQ